jgi:hypothetical protein
MSQTNAQIHLQELRNQNQFDYNLGINIIASKNSNNEVTICCHGYGHNNQIVDEVHSPGNLIGFNFPDYNINPSIDHKKAAYGTINELLPLLYILKRCVIDLKLPKINLYGFSAGGGAIINALGLLNQNNYEKELNNIGVTAEVKKQIINALEQGIIILDCPLKSFDEIVDTRIKSHEFATLASAYKKNNLRPIDSLLNLSGIKFTILLHFQTPDEILGNRDDQLFIDRLKKANQGTTTVILGRDGGHNVYHATLWNHYKKLQ